MPRLAKFAAIHEAAHAVSIVANRMILRADIKYVSIVPDHRMVRLCEPLEYHPADHRKLRAIIQVALAGVAANVAFSRMGRFVALLSTGVEDWQLASDAAQCIDNLNLDEFLEDTIGFVKRERAAVHALADALMLKGQIPGEEAVRLIADCLTKPTRRSAHPISKKFGEG